MFTLSMLGLYEKAKVVSYFECSGKQQECVKQLQNMGIKIGSEVEIVAKQARGPIIAKVDNSRIAIGRGLAHKIIIEKE